MFGVIFFQAGQNLKTPTHRLLEIDERRWCVPIRALFNMFDSKKEIETLGIVIQPPPGWKPGWKQDEPGWNQDEIDTDAGWHPGPSPKNNFGGAWAAGGPLNLFFGLGPWFRPASVSISPWFHSGFHLGKIQILPNWKPKCHIQSITIRRNS